jgi:hypothetical protein
MSTQPAEPTKYVRDEPRIRSQRVHSSLALA